MKIQYFQDTDTLYIEFKTTEVAQTKDLDEDTLLDLDRDGNIAAITIEHASNGYPVTARMMGVTERRRYQRWINR
jgi:uncharacterized protein YuzE